MSFIDNNGLKTVISNVNHQDKSLQEEISSNTDNINLTTEILQAILKELKNDDDTSINEAQVISIIQTYLQEHTEYKGATEEQLQKILSNEQTIKEIQNKLTSAPSRMKFCLI